MTDIVFPGHAVIRLRSCWSVLSRRFAARIANMARP